MLLKQLSDADRRIFLCLAELVSLCDKPMLWNGKRREEATTADFKADEISLEWDSPVFAAMKELASRLVGDDDFDTMRMPGSDNFWSFTIGGSMGGSSRGGSSVAEALTKRLKDLPLSAEGDPAARVTVAAEVLRDILKDHQAATPSVPKLMLFELFLLSLTGGSLSSIQWQVLAEVKHHYKLEDYIVDDLLERARSTHAEAQKTIAIILE